MVLDKRTGGLSGRFLWVLRSVTPQWGWKGLELDSDVVFQQNLHSQDPLLFLQALQPLWSTRELRQGPLGHPSFLQCTQAQLPITQPQEGWWLLWKNQRYCSGRKPGGGLLPWITRLPVSWTCWRAAGAGRGRTPPWRPGSPVSCSAGCRQSRAQAGPSLGLKELQARAVRVLAESPPSLAGPLVSIFQLQDADRSPLLAYVRRLHQEGKFKEAVMLSTKLKLQPELDVEKMGTPLLLQDKVNLVERYVDGFPDLQRRLLVLMDSWCQPDFDIRVVARQHPKVTSLKLEKLSPKVLSRQVLHLLERFGLDPALCPNVVAQQRLAALRYLCYKRFVERSMSQENWADHVQDLVGQNEWLQEQLLKLLTSHSDTATAAQCALDLSLPEARLPATVAAELSRLRLQESSTPPRMAEAPFEDRRDDYYQLPVTRENVHFLASWEDLARHEEELLQPGLVGVDLEWRPSFGTGGRPQVSLMQVAVEGHVFLLDLLVLSQTSQAFSQLVLRLLSDPSITKLGYGMAGDLRSLGASCPALAHVEKQLRGSLDLQQVHRQMRVVDMPAPSVDGTKGPRGLSLLVQQVLGKPLDKRQQLSNWDRRPLSEAQLVYAATDAYCLLEVYRVLCRDPTRFHLSEDLAKSLRPGRSQRPGAREQPSQQEASALPQQVPVAEGEDTTPEIQARAFRVVCDSMLQGLARSLRCLGVDVLVLGTGEDHRRAAEVARQEGRVILTSGLPYHKLRAQVRAGRCLSVDCSLKARQQAKAVLRHFNVRVTHADIFSRCQACNCDQYLKVSKDMMKQLMGLSGHQESPSNTGDEDAQSEDAQEPGSAPAEAPGGSTYDPPCRWLEASDLQASVPGTLGNGTRLQLAGVPVGVLRRPGLRHFYCCTGCGKVFWEGSHLGRVTANFHEVLEGPPAPASPASSPS
ncbi:exonuclease mut-7 homolog isoform X6 [Equus asinus]|uniref:exonuclease mut-7 homolog isoform X6 n=1 Tax=Equus asinus TaxID=9793 RepID=UPI0038F78E57